jgi:glyoxylase-like metal-dependent hydrolase (beta-lactamase superfamily II)
MEIINVARAFICLRVSPVTIFARHGEISPDSEPVRIGNVIVAWYRRNVAAAGHARCRCSILRAPLQSSGARVRLQYSCLALVALVGATVTTASFAQPRTPPREITQVTGDLYRARNGNWYTVFLVTPAGIILGDPINETFAPWLKGELDARFPGLPVRYVVYSHSHFDHAAGGAAFADTATFVAHENMLRNMDGRYPQMPGDMIDRNDNGVIDRDEIDIPTNTRPGVCGMGPGFFDGIDRNSDGIATPQELQQFIVRPTIVYNDRMRLEFGGKVVELVHPGLNHSNDATVMVFPAERAAFATEFIVDALVGGNPRSLPSACGPFDGSPLAEWIKSYRTVEGLDFDVMVTGHGPNFVDKAFVRETREFFEELRNAVAAGMAAGQSLEQLKQSVTLERYKDWANYERLRANNVEAAYRNLLTYR